MRQIIYLLFTIISLFDGICCTSAIISGSMTRDGRPLLWKNRDTSHLVNHISQHEATDSTHSYVALYNSDDVDEREAWIGFNDVGFAIMNTASYNLSHPSDNWKDREGYIMSEALSICETVDDFYNLLQSISVPRGIEANFGVIDAYGNGAYFEADDYKISCYPIDDDNLVIVRTNFSVSGGEGGLGRVRYDTACELLKPHIEAQDIVPELLTDGLSRSFYYSPEKTDKALGSLVKDEDFIPRYSTSASAVVEGVNNPSDALTTTMWTLIGYPPCGVTEAVTMNEIPQVLLKDSHGGCSASRDAQKLKKKLFIRKKDGWYIKMSELQKISNQNKIKSLNNYKVFREK